MVKYLRGLYLQGFKSFPVKTQLELVEGITGIVGSNGSGKSNIVEAIRWVLGEQSAKSLRGEKMEDVIFNGTKDRAAMSMAEVGLIFDNGNHWLPIDFSEVSVSRRMFRSGEGQYSINKSRVRLKDIVELFLDTGVGRDSYSIFEQGKIDRLLSESPFERRALFEDFAGISKFKFRKEEAEKKLQNSRINLERLNDIINELEKEVNSLKEQAENASCYQEVKTELHRAELKFEALRKANFEKEIENKTIQKSMHEEKMKPLIDQLMEDENKIIQMEESIQKEEEEFNMIRDEYTHAEREFGELNSRLANNLERKKAMEEQIRNQENRFTEGEERGNDLKSELAEKNSEMNSISSEKESVSEKMRHIEAEIDEFKLSIASLERMSLHLSRGIGFENIISKDDVEKNKQEIIALQTRIENFRAALEEKWNLMKMIEHQINEKKAQMEITEQNISFSTEELKKAVKDIEILQDEEKVLKNKNHDLNIEMKTFHEEASKMDHLILEALEKQSKLIKDFRGKKPELEAEIDLIFADLTVMIRNNSSFESIKTRIETLKTQFSRMREYYESILNVLYSDEGSYTKKETLIRKIDQTGTLLTANTDEIEKIRDRIRDLQVIREGIQNNYNKEQYDSASIKAEIEKLSSDNLTVQESLKIIENHINDISIKIKLKQDITEEMFKIMVDFEGKLLKIKSDLSNNIEELNISKVEYARVDEKYKSLENEIHRIKNQIADIDRMKETYTNDRKDLESSMKEMNAKIIEDETGRSRLSAVIEDYKNNIENKRNFIENMRIAKKSIENKRKNKEESIQKLEKMVAGLDNSISERRGFLSSINDNVQKNYGVDIRSVIVEKGDNFDKISANINELRNELQKLGNVNLLAIEQYQNTKERLDFLSVQKQDSEKAIADIMILIDETNKKSIDQFVSAFEDIRKGFKKIFARLFEGGRADLILDNKKDVLNSGVNIFAEPPGKKFQSISLLSGGEKALVAIAVIFSILYLKPTPFVVLDEIDASLDDDNIERFKSLLNDFKETSQFVIVSHSKSTLEICNTLYGVTMEEMGVSKIVNVAFENADVIFKTIDDELTQ